MACISGVLVRLFGCNSWSLLASWWAFFNTILCSSGVRTCISAQWEWWVSVVWHAILPIRSEVRKGECTRTNLLGWPWSSKSAGTCLSGYCPAQGRVTLGWIEYSGRHGRGDHSYLTICKEGYSPQPWPAKTQQNVCRKEHTNIGKTSGTSTPRRKTIHVLDHENVPLVALGGLLVEASATFPQWGESEDLLLQLWALGSS